MPGAQSSSKAVSSRVAVPASRKTKASEYPWSTGDIAHLHHLNEAQKQEMWDKKLCSLPKGTSEHPVIILSRPTAESQYVLVTTVSAWSSNELNKYRAPWELSVNRRRAGDDFRSFTGSARANVQRDLLRLEGGRKMPKYNTSWVYIQRVDIVPVSALGYFRGAKDTVLRVTPASLDDLLAHMQAENPGMKHTLDNLLRITDPAAYNAQVLAQKAKHHKYVQSLVKLPPKGFYNSLSVGNKSKKPKQSASPPPPQQRPSSPAWSSSSSSSKQAAQSPKMVLPSLPSPVSPPTSPEPVQPVPLKRTNSGTIKRPTLSWAAVAVAVPAATPYLTAPPRAVPTLS